MKRILCIILLGLGCFKASTQQYFNIRDPLHSFYSILTASQIINGKYYCSGVCWDSVNYIGNGTAYGITGVKFAVFDEYGHKLRDTIYQRQDRDINAWNGQMHPQNDGTFLIATDAIDTTNRYLLLICLDSFGRLVWEKEFTKPVCTGIKNDFWRMVDFQPDGSGNWLTLSTVKCANPSQHDFMLIKLDSSFNMIWHKTYGNGWNDLASKILIEPNGYIIAGGVNNTNWVTKNFSFQAKIICTDTAGNVQWTYLSPANRLTNTIQDIIKTQDGGYVYCGQGDGVEDPAPDGIHADIGWKGWVEKIDVNRNIVWSMTTSPEISNWASTNQTALKEFQNGDVAVGGSVWKKVNATDTENYHFGTITKLNSGGNILWQKHYNHPGDTLVYLIYDMKTTSDGGFVLCGEATDKYYPYNPPTQRGWLIKVDSNGCMSATDPQCQPTTIPLSPQLSSAVQVYPNPVNDVLYVRYSKVSKFPVFITLYDLYGRLLLSKTLESSNQEIATSQLQAGVYFYKITEGRNVEAQGKLIKQ